MGGSSGRPQPAGGASSNADERRVGSDSPRSSMFPRANRLTDRRSFQILAREGKRARGGFVEVKYLVTRRPLSRVAVVISTRVEKKAVRRNRMKRKLRIFLDEIVKNLQQSVDLACYVKRTIREEDWPAVENELISGLAHLSSS